MFRSDLSIKSRGVNSVLIKGGYDSSKTFGDILDTLFRFYDQKGLVFVPETQKFDPLVNKYTHRVFTGEFLDMKIKLTKTNQGLDQKINQISNAPMHGFLNLLFKRQVDRKQEIEHDYAQNLPSATIDYFILYFDLINKNPSVRDKERNEFIDFVRFVPVH